MMRSKKWKSAFFCGWLFLCCFPTFGCNTEQPPIRIGFSGGITGRYSDLGVSGRNGVMLAVEEINRAGGIQGRQVELIIRDDRQDPETAIKADQDLISQNVAAIIGHMTSAMTMAVMPLINREQVLLISPTTSTSELTGIDDWFFRTAGENEPLARGLAEQLIQKRSIQKIAVIFDSSNQSYSVTYIKAFRSRLVELGGRLTLVAAFSSGNDPLRDVISQTLLQPPTDGVLIIAGGLDAALICQQIRKQHPTIPIAATGWSMTGDFLEHGGPAVEGTWFMDYFDWNSMRPSYVQFQKAYRERFGMGPIFSAVYAYDAAQVLFQGLSGNTDPKELRKTIIGIGHFSGVMQDIEIDAFGDAHRHPFIITASNGRFVTLE